MARQPIPIGIKMAGVAIVFLLIFALTRIPSSMSAAIAFERGRNDEQKHQFAAAEDEYRKSVRAFPRSDLAHTRLFVAAYRARDTGTARHEFEYLRGHQLDAKLVGEISALLGARH
jgi:Na+-transporting methylmalonyl-CoA/oxaloacetate decarboxylase gamma subunit